MKTSENNQHAHAEMWIYNHGDKSVDGVFPPLIDRLSKDVEFDGVRFEFEKGRRTALDEQPWERRCVLGLRNGIYKVLRINLVREVGRTIVRLRVVEQNDVRRVLVICREHFDEWFCVDPCEVKSDKH